MVGVGIDIVEFSEVEEALRANASRYLDHVYTPAEQRATRRPDGSPDPCRLAGLFAAKEAAVKALAPDGEALPWRTIEVQAGGRGLALSGAAASLARGRGITVLRLDVTRCAGYAAAIVIAQGAEVTEPASKAPKPA